VWSESWRSLEERLEELEARLRAVPVRVRRGGAFDRWDLEIRAGLLGGGRLRMAIEEHGEGKQLVRIHSWPRPTAIAAGITAVFAAIAIAAGASRIDVPARARPERVDRDLRTSRPTCEGSEGPVRRTVGRTGERTAAVMGTTSSGEMGCGVRPRW
jgi:hypothetical protein